MHQGTAGRTAAKIKAGLDLQLQLQGLPTVTLLFLTYTGPGYDSGEGGTSVAMVAGLVVCCCVVTACLAYPLLLSKTRVESEEDKQVRCTMEALRSRLGITLREGFMLSTETSAVLGCGRCWPSIAGKRAETVVVRSSNLEAAARLALLEVISIIIGNDSGHVSNAWPES